MATRTPRRRRRNCTTTPRPKYELGAEDQHFCLLHVLQTHSHHQRERLFSRNGRVASQLFVMGNSSPMIPPHGIHILPLVHVHDARCLPAGILAHHSAELDRLGAAAVLPSSALAAALAAALPARSGAAVVSHSRQHTVARRS
ncbi:unnamed protein product, partial [Ectocarpus sp. 12 AP-2014]